MLYIILSNCFFNANNLSYPTQNIFNYFSKNMKLVRKLPNCVRRLNKK